MLRTIKYDDLATADLRVNAVYEGQQGGQLSGEALSKLLPGIGNLGGFRASGKGDDKRFVVLCTSGGEKEWPDRLDLRTGEFIYFGDNRVSGKELHATPHGGNRILRHAFELLHAVPHQRESICPFLVFQNHTTDVSSRSFQFKGLAVPGGAELPETVDLVAFWKTSNGPRFLNYRATFTILDAPRISRAWIDDFRAGKVPSMHAPSAWRGMGRDGKVSTAYGLERDRFSTMSSNIPILLLKASTLQNVNYGYGIDRSQILEFEALEEGRSEGAP